MSAFQKKHDSFDYIEDEFNTEMSALKYAVDGGQDVAAASESLKVYGQLRELFDKKLKEIINSSADDDDGVKSPAQIKQLVESLYKLPRYGEDLKTAVSQLDLSFESMSRHYERNFVIPKTLSRISNWIYKTYEP